MYQPPALVYVYGSKIIYLGLFKPFTVSAHDLLELEELIEEVDPNGGTVPFWLICGIFGEFPVKVDDNGVATAEFDNFAFEADFKEERPLPGKAGVVADLVKVRCGFDPAE